MKLLLLILCLPLIGFGQEFYSARLDDNYALHLVIAGDDTIMLVQADTTTVVAVAYDYQSFRLFEDVQFLASMKYVRNLGAPHNQFTRTSRVGWGKDKYGHHVLFMLRRPTRDAEFLKIVSEALPEVVSLKEIDSGSKAFLYVKAPTDQYIEMGYPTRILPTYCKKTLCFYKPK